MKILVPFALLLSLSACAAQAPAQPMPSQSLSAQARSGAVQIRLFRSYGSDGQVHLRGRVMRPENLRPETPEDNSLINFWRNLMALTVREVAGVAVDFTLNGRSQRLVSDKEGMLMIATSSFGPLAPGLHTLEAKLAPGQKFSAAAVTQQMVIHPSADASLAVVSDIDDTIKISNVTNRLKALRRLLFQNAYGAKPMPGTAMLYQILEKKDGQADGDTFYLSGSPLNLSDAIYRFMDLRGFPAGGIELKKWGFAEGDESPFAQSTYKTERLRQLFKTYPQKRFLLFGDSGEKDPEIYRQIASEFPAQVQGIFINNVTQAKPGDPRFQGIHLTRDAGEAAQILAQQGLLTPAEAAQVQQTLQTARAAGEPG
ncbi:MAG: phosphatase domain-containing protein [Candidatus Sericytochromatia bacterium]